MSLYREPGGRRTRAIVVAAIAGAVVGLLAGLAIGSGGDDEASLPEALAAVRAEVEPALNELELVPIEYEDAARTGGESEYGASADHLARAGEKVDAAAEDLDALDPEAAAAAQRSLDELERLIQARAPAARVAAAAELATARIEAAAGIS